MASNAVRRPRDRLLPLTAAETFGRLVLASALDEAHDLLMSLESDEFEQLIEDVGASLHAQGVVPPNWHALSEAELDKFARGAFDLQNGTLVVLGEA